MLSPLHEGLVTLFREHPALAPELLVEALRAELPEYTEVRFVSGDLTEMRPVERRADAVIHLEREGSVFGIVVEVQLRKDEDKGYVWPVYVATLRDRIRCPVCLLVVTPDEKVASWARQPILLGGNSRLVPWVLHPANIPEVSVLEEAERYPELAVLSAIAHGHDSDVHKSVEIALAAQCATAGLDRDRSNLYFDLVLGSLSEAARQELEAMSAGRYEYISDFARAYFGQGRAEGRSEGRAEGRSEGRAEGRAEGEVRGRAEIALRQLSFRFGVLSDATQSRLQRASIAELDALAERILSAGTLSEALGELE
jgi:hypothetical protein